MSAGRRVLVDTNVLLYFVDGTDTRKRERSRLWLEALWREGCGAVSWQVLHEFYSNATRKMGVAPGQARGLVELFVEWRPADTTLGLMGRAWHWMDEANVSYWDALILAAAEVSGCGALLSEDFQAGRWYGGIQVVNPFEVMPAEFLRKN